MSASYLRQSTASQSRAIGPFVDDTLSLPPGMLRARSIAACNRAELGPLVIPMGGDKCKTTRGTDRFFANPSGRIRVVPLEMRGGRQKFEVFSPVIGTILVDVMDDLATNQRSAQMFAHDKAVLGNVAGVAPLQGVGMVRTKHVDVSIFRNEPAAFPSRVACPTKSMTRKVANIISPFDAESRCPTRREPATTPALAMNRHTLIIAPSQNGGNTR